MKKIYLLTITAFFFSASLLAQDIPNDGMESWENFGNYENPENWDTPNEEISFFNVSVVTKESSIVHSGNYSAKLQNKDVYAIGTVPGFMTLGDFSVDTQTGEFTIEGGVPYTDRPSSLKGYFQYDPQNNEECVIGAFLFRRDEQNNVDTIGAGVFMTGENTGNWTEFSAPITYFSNEQPDTLNIIALTSATENPTAGTKLYVDDLWMESAGQEIQLQNGYQFASTHMIPDNPDLMVLLEDLMNDETLDFVRDSDGSMLTKIGPNWVNNIGNWNTTEGYLFKMLEDDMVSFSGSVMDPTTPIPVNTGYMFISYLPQSPMDALDATESIQDNLIFMRDSDGAMLQKIGPNWVNNIGDMEPGEGYLIKMEANDELVYPVESLEKAQKTKVNFPMPDSFK
ncbi:MAG: PCMD domain-containing protein [Bacteroidales bacterium]|nr:PCMD domain-containing protein [Bacteroidales bacterium]